jgi:hypothetical protein
MQRDVLHALGADLFAWTAEILRVLERYLTEAGWPEPALEARLLFAEIDGMHQHYVLAPDHYPIEAMTRRLVDRYRTPPAPQRKRKTR